MSDCVPDFHDMEDDYDIPTSSDFSRPTKSTPGEEDVMELMWQNGQAVVQKSLKESLFLGEPADGKAGRDIRPGNEEQQQSLFMQEDEMSSWLHYPLDDSSFDRDFYADILYSAPPPPPPAPAIAPPVPRKPEASPRPHKFSHFSRIPIRSRSDAPSVTAEGHSAVVESNVTPAIRPESKVSHTVAESLPPVNTESGTSTAARDFSRKRKDKEADDSESQSEDIEFEASEARKLASRSSSTKRSRAAEVHNLSERKRRDRINEKMRALQELIPRCNKSDKASMLDEAIEYLKSLQMQVQMMSMGYGMIPMMYPGMQQYMPALGMGIGMGMDIGMNRPIVPYPYTVQGSGIPNAAAAAHGGPRFPIPGFHLPPPRMPNFVDPYQQFLSLQQAQLPLPQV